MDQSGTPEGYVLYDGTGCTIDTANTEAVGSPRQLCDHPRVHHQKREGARDSAVQRSPYRDRGLRHQQVGSEDEKGWGKDYQAAVFSNQRDLRAVVIQRCRMHHPTWDTNSWAEKHGESNHPAGPQTVVFWESEGNHVIRYNECWSDADHYFNDGMGAGYNGGWRGFPGADSDIYCNTLPTAGTTASRRRAAIRTCGYGTTTLRRC